MLLRFFELGRFLTACAYLSLGVIFVVYWIFE